MESPGPAFRGNPVRPAPVGHKANFRSGFRLGPDHQEALRGNLVGPVAVAVARGVVKAVDVASQTAATEAAAMALMGTMKTMTATTRPLTRYELER